MSEQRVPMTPEGYRKLQQELKRLKSEERPAVVKAIEEARAHGDLTENAEYDAAKEKQAQLERRINEIEDKLARAEVIDPSRMKGDKVVFGAKVLLTDLNTNKQVSYQLVGDEEADINERKISVHSPVARAIIGKSVGDMVLVRTPGGEREYVVEEIIFE
ncbi:MAG: transcription elongation factor GreA [Deltaproteobacteria bacterium]|nr:MAG: transcription elongation factor GreA [Deltaproteobacteria bacterium]